MRLPDRDAPACRAPSSPVALFTPDGAKLIVAIKGGPDGVGTSEGDMWFRMDQWLFEDGRAAGTAGLSEEESLYRGFNFRFQDG